MDMNPLIIGNLKARFPIIQGGMGVGVSRWRLADRLQERAESELFPQPRSDTTSPNLRDSRFQQI